MLLDRFKCVSNNVNIDDYYKLYNYVKEKMEKPEWLGLIPKEETEEILKNGGKIWLYYDEDNLVSSMFYIPVKEKTLKKHKINIDENLVGSLGPIMVSPDYVGKGLMNEMLEVFEKYTKSINKKYIFTKVATDNIYSIKNIEKNNYKLVDIYINERGSNNAYSKELD